jgi:hypothetical protein
MITDPKHPDLPKGIQFTGNYMTQLVSNKPVEAIIYTSNLAKIPIVVGTPDGKVWMVQNGKMSIDRSKPDSNTIGGVVKQALKQQ